ncbi:conserved hypothetical protein [Vibrio crassostreae]|nr:conserved hypothetical protein [Vibrio crassostreae]CAK3503470.1 conserved hypothetical protein [Vibrio crassostreae]
MNRIRNMTVRSLFKVKPSSLIKASLASIFVLVISAIENRVLSELHSEPSVVYSQYSYNGKFGNAGRGLSYDIILNEEDGAEYKVQGYDFARLRRLETYRKTGRLEPGEIGGIRVGLVPTRIENIDQVVYIEFNNQVLREASSAISDLNKRNRDRLVLGFVGAVICFLLIVAIENIRVRNDAN